MSHIVAIADVGHANIPEIAEAFLQREIVGQRLARMLEIAERVDDWNRGVLGHSLDCLLGEGAQYDGIHPTLQVMRDVTQFFARVESLMRLVHEKRSSAQAGHSRFKR